MNISKLGAFVGALALLGAAAAGAYAQGHPNPATPQPKHNSNTLSKIGKAIQYTTRKDTENAVKDTHHATNSKSVTRNRHTGNNYVETPTGKHIFKSTTNPKILHRKYGRHHHRHHRMHYAKK